MVLVVAVVVVVAFILVPSDYDVEDGGLGETVIVGVRGRGRGDLLVHPGVPGVMVCRRGSSGARQDRLRWGE